MKRKLIALLMAMMLIASGISAFAVDGSGKYESNDIAAMNAWLVADPDYAQVQEVIGYTIDADGLNMVVETTTYSLSVAVGDAAHLYFTEAYVDRNPAAIKAVLKDSVTSSTSQSLVQVNADTVTAESIAALQAKYPDYTFVMTKDHKYVTVDGKYLLTNGIGGYILAAINASTETPDIGGQVTTGPDDFNLTFSNYDGSVISAFSFKPEVFGNGVTFSHKNAKSLFSMTVKYDAEIVIQLRDDEGRLYPVSGATYDAAKNGYVTTMKANASKTFGWYGTDGAGYHKAGSLEKPATINLDLNVWATTTGKNADGSAWAKDRADMRFEYIVKHGTDNHSGNYSGNSGSSSPKTGDARMAYLTLASLVVLAGVAVIITRKLRTNA